MTPSKFKVFSLLVSCLLSGSAWGAPAPLSRADILAYAQSAVGHGYKWGGGHWTSDLSRAGSCTGTCPSCSFTPGAVGTDCSGLVAKVWQIPEPTPLEDDAHPYSTWNYYFEEAEWSRIDRSELLPGDALVERHGDAGHVVLFDKEGTRGRLWVYEARGCLAGVVYNERTFGPEYIAIRRNNLIESGVTLAVVESGEPELEEWGASEAQGSGAAETAGVSGALQIVLSWAAAIDLDFHALMADGSELNFDEECRGALDEPPYATLDVDQSGPNASESITLASFEAAPIRLFVHNFDYPDLSWDESAQVQVLDASGELIEEFFLPNGEGAFWDVIEFSQDGSFLPLQTTHDAARWPGEYEQACYPDGPR